MNRNVVIIVGAGSTLSDAASKSLRRRPPLDQGFFKSCGKLGLRERLLVLNYLRKNYDIDPTSPEHDSLEKMMAVIYADINNPRLELLAVEAFRTLIKLFNRRIAETTNELKPTNQTNLYKIIAKLFREGVLPENISIVTYNQDIQIEKVLQRLQKTKAYNKLGKIFSFPTCYSFSRTHERLTIPPTGIERFEICEENETGLKVLKLHGSLNWFSIHNSKRVRRSAILDANKKFNITPRSVISPDMTLKKSRRTSYTFPLIIPPVNHKAAIIHRDLYPIWSEAEKKLRNADEILVFGYSCPNTDFESANLLRRATNSGTNPSSFVVIDPNPSVFQRYVDITNLDHLSYFRNVDAFLEKG